MSERETEGKRQERRSQAESDRVAAEYESSGLSRKAFCERNGVGLNTLASGVTRYRKRKTASSQVPEWIAVEMAGRDASGSEITVLLTTGRRVEVKRGFDAGTLRQLLAVLE